MHFLDVVKPLLGAAYGNGFMAMAIGGAIQLNIKDVDTIYMRTFIVYCVLCYCVSCFVGYS